MLETYNKSELPMEGRMRALLEQAFSPQHIEIVNNSHLHAGHAGDDGTGETHFHLTIVSDLFESQSRVDRQRAVYNALNVLFNSSLHALECKCFTIIEWNLKSGVVD